MALQYSVAIRDLQLNQVEIGGGTTVALEIRTGTPPATCATASSGSILATINLPADWMAAASSGSKGILGGPWTDASADNTGTAGHFRLYTSQATKDGTTCFLQGTYGTSGTDMIGDSVSFTAGQSFSVTAFTISAGNA
jgi:hypothetical protein